MKLPALFFFLIALLFPVVTSAAGDDHRIHILTTGGEEILSFTPFSGNDESAGSVSAADLGQDGVAEILVGAGYGTKPVVRVFRQDGSMIGEFLAYAEAFRGGVNVTSCDLDGNGQREIITGAGFGGGPHVRVFTNMGTPTGTQFFAYDLNFRGGVTVACADITGDNEPEIITGAGVTGGPHVRVFSNDGELLSETFTGFAHEGVGVSVTTGDVTGDGTADILTSPIAYSTPSVTTLTWNNGSLRKQSVFTLGENKTHGTFAIAVNTNGTSQNEILTSAGAFGGDQLSILTSQGVSIGAISSRTTTTNAAVLATTLRDDAGEKIITLDAATPLINAPEQKYIKVDISEQKLTAYDNGVPVHSFLVSTGLPGRDTPLGTFSVTDKIPMMDYAWYYGADDPRNYHIPNVAYNLRFKPHFYIHSAYWHNNFGQRMSHGCVNTSYKDAEWIFNWAHVGTTVDIQG